MLGNSKDDWLTEEFKHCVRDDLETVLGHLGAQVKEDETRRLIERKIIPFPLPPHKNEMDN
jgi:hypothetical protein